MEKTMCQKCYHYEACKAIDLTGAVVSPNPEVENESCLHFIDADLVKIQEKAKWKKRITRYNDGDVHVTYRCSKCNDLSRVKCYKQAEWDGYFSNHYHEHIELPQYCSCCGSVVNGVIPVDD